MVVQAVQRLGFMERVEEKPRSREGEGGKLKVECVCEKDCPYIITID